MYGATRDEHGVPTDPEARKRHFAEFALSVNGGLARDTCGMSNNQMCNFQNWDELVSLLTTQGSTQRMGDLLAIMRPAWAPADLAMDRVQWAQTTMNFYTRSLALDKQGVHQPREGMPEEKIKEIVRGEELHYISECKKLLLGTPSSLSESSIPFCKTFMEKRKKWWQEDWVMWAAVGGAVLVGIAIMGDDDVRS